MKIKNGWRGFTVFLIFAAGIVGCGKQETDAKAAVEDTVKIELSDQEIKVDGQTASRSESEAVYCANDIVFYLEDQGISYGEGSAEDEHSQAEADNHTVVHITRPGNYELSGKLSAGQIFVDLGEDAKEDPDAVVTLVLNNAEVNCSVAPAILFYNVYECGDEDAENADMNVDLSLAGANVILADGSTNVIRGSHVAKIFESCELNEDGTEVVDSKKLHKYDGAFHSKRSINLYGDTGILKITADNEGLCSDMHMAIHGGNISIESGNDGINTSEDEVSVFTLNGGTLQVTVTGETGEGDGIDSNGWLIVNGGNLYAAACGTSQDSGIDADKGIYINGGTVVATGNMLDEISVESQPYQAFMSRGVLSGKTAYTVKDAYGEELLEVTPANDFCMMVVSLDEINEEDIYTLWNDDQQVAESGPGRMGGPGMGRRDEMGFPEGKEPPERKGFPEGMMPPREEMKQSKNE